MTTLNLKTVTYRQLQQAIKAKKASGSIVKVKLNSSFDILKAEWLRILDFESKVAHVKYSTPNEFFLKDSDVNHQAQGKSRPTISDSKPNPVGVTKFHKQLEALKILLAATPKSNVAKIRNLKAMIADLEGKLNLLPTRKVEVNQPAREVRAAYKNTKSNNYRKVTYNQGW